MRLMVLPVLVSCTPPAVAVVQTSAPVERVDDLGFDHDWEDTADLAPVIGRVHTVLHDERYTLHGRTAHELATDLHVQRPRDERFTGWTRWRLRWRFEPHAFEGSCYVGPVDVDLELTTVLPEWEPPEGADPRLVSAWDGYLDALQHHEEGHADLARDAAERIRDRLTDLAPDVDCGRLRELAHDIGHEEVQRLRDDNAHLDEVTAHGATQGAIFPGPRRLAEAMTGG